MSDHIPDGLETAIAVIGMGVRLPDAPTPDAYWRNLRDGVESIRFFSDDELRARGVADELLNHPDYVKAGVVLDDFDMWDAPFFGFNPRDAEIMDPQHRVFMECTWEALENAGVDPARFEGSIGLFAGSGMAAYMTYNLVPNRDLMESAGLFLVRHTGNDKDFLTTRVSYTFDLKGPSLNVQTACSTSLVAIHLAAQHLLSGECDIALAGGVTIELPHGTGHLYKDGEILSPDGHCRAFDAQSKGTIFGSGAGVVVLRRLADAMAAGDRIHAIIRGSAVNNDGASKIGYLAPSVDGQARAIAEALAVAGTPPETVSYVETHGTGTPVGDPIEVAALTQAFRTGTERRGYCALASVKSNIGHTDTAAGVAGFIKAVLSLENRQIPPSLHYTAPNPAIDFESSPFYVNNRLLEWESDGPRRCAVNSLGVGGTNAFVVLEEAPAAQPSSPSREHQLVLLSARTKTALDAATSNLADHLRETDSDLADIAFTLQVGRRGFAERRALVGRTVAGVADLLDAPGAEGIITGTASDQSPAAAFMFAGGGAQYPGMCRGLYESEPVFRAAVDECLAHVQPELDTDLRTLLFPGPDADIEAVRRTLERPSLALPALFTMQYAQALLWRSWGIEPQAMIGHSMGEYTAACLAGVFTVRDALSIVAMRGRLFEQLPEGGMLSVPLTPDQLTEHLTPELSIAAVNGPELCVASGPNEPLAALQAKLEGMDVECRRVHISVAAHSSMLEPILKPFGEFLRTVRFSAPQLPVVSNLSGDWLRPDEAMDPDYWVRHLRHTVRFSEGLQLLLDEPSRVLLEVGPGRTLATLARIHPARAATQQVFNSVRHPDEPTHDQAFMLGVLGGLWVAGMDVDWASFHDGEQRARVPLPTYPFERRRYWIEATPATGAAATAADPQARRGDVDDWFSEVVWRRAPLVATPAESTEKLLVFALRGAAGELLVDELRSSGADVCVVFPGQEYAAGNGAYGVRPAEPADYARLLRDLAAAGSLPRRVLHAWTMEGETDAGTACEYGFYSLLHLAQACGEQDLTELRIVVVTAGAQEVGGEGIAAPSRAVVLGPARVMPKEFPGITCRTVDIDRAPGAATSAAVLAQRLLAELRDDSDDDLVALRGPHRFVQSVEPVRLPQVEAGGLLRPEGVYLVTGGLGGMALEIAKDLVRRVDARLVLVSRSPLPPESDWESILSTTPDGPGAARIRAVRELRELGGEVLVVAADVTDRGRMEAAIAAGEAHFGAIHGVIHAAGVLDDGLMQLKTREQAAAVLAPKVEGTLLLDELFRGRALDFMALFSSVSAFAGLAGQADYTAASAFLDAFAQQRMARDDTPTVSIGWSAWRDVGMTAGRARAAGAGAAQTLAVTHPLLHAGVRKPDGDDVFTAELSPRKDWVLAEHRIRGGQPLIPGTGYLELARAALEVEPGDGVVELRDIFFMSPFVVADDASRMLRVELSRQRDGEFVVLGQVGENGEWEEHVRGSANRVAAAPVAYHDLHALLARCAHPNGAGASSSYLQFGPRWSNVVKVHYGNAEAVAELSLPAEYTTDLEQFAIHPAMLDMATAGAQGLIGADESEDQFFVPIGYGIVRLHRRMPAHVFSHIRYRPMEGARHDVAIFDVTLIGADGEEIATISDFTMKRVTAAALQHADGSISTVRRDDGASAGLLVDLEDAIRPEEGAAAFVKLLGSTGRPHVIVSPKDVRPQLEEWRRPAAAAARQPARRAPAEDPQLRADLARIREVLEQVDAVAEAFALAKSGRGGERRLLAYVVFTPGESATVSELRRHAKKNLPAHLVPGNFIELDSFPRNDAGEIAASDLPDPFGPVDDHVPPRTEMEKRIAAIWRDVIGVDDIGAHDNFFDIGGHSLLAVRVITRIDREMGVRLDQAVMVLQTLEQIAARCERSAPTAAAQPLVAATN